MSDIWVGTIRGFSDASGRKGLVERRSCPNFNIGAGEQFRRSERVSFRRKSPNCRDSMLANREIGGSKLVWIDGEGHEIFIDRADRCVNEIKEFITSLAQNSSK